jgi:hypothetical protein
MKARGCSNRMCAHVVLAAGGPRQIRPAPATCNYYIPPSTNAPLKPPAHCTTSLDSSRKTANGTTSSMLGELRAGNLARTALRRLLGSVTTCLTRARGRGLESGRARGAAIDGEFRHSLGGGAVGGGGGGVLLRLGLAASGALLLGLQAAAACCCFALGSGLLFLFSPLR